MRRVILTMIVLAAQITPVWAYLDPGTGSMILQGVAAAVAAAAGAFTLGWYRIKQFFGRIVGGRSKADKDGPR